MGAKTEAIAIVSTMNKPKRRQYIDDRTAPVEEDQRLIESPKPKRYVPPACCSCINTRQAGDDRDYEHVYSVHRIDGYIVRYIKCDWCGNTYKDMEKVE